MISDAVTSKRRHGDDWRADHRIRPTFTVLILGKNRPSTSGSSHRGPYSADVARDLDVVAGLSAAQINYDFGFAGYEIHPGPAGAELRERAKAFLHEISPKLDRLIADFGGFSAKDLELRSTVVYLFKPDRGQPELIKQVHEVKPHFSVTQIEAAISELEKKGYVGFSSTRTASN
jgi:hypothetical protein